MVAPTSSHIPRTNVHAAVRRGRKGPWHHAAGTIHATHHAAVVALHHATSGTAHATRRAWLRLVRRLVLLGESGNVTGGWTVLNEGRLVVALHAGLGHEPAAKTRLYVVWPRSHCGTPWRRQRACLRAVSSLFGCIREKPLCGEVAQWVAGARLDPLAGNQRSCARNSNQKDPSLAPLCPAMIIGPMDVLGIADPPDPHRTLDANSLAAGRGTVKHRGN